MRLPEVDFRVLVINVLRNESPASFKLEPTFSSIGNCEVSNGKASGVSSSSSLKTMARSTEISSSHIMPGQEYLLSLIQISDPTRPY